MNFDLKFYWALFLRRLPVMLGLGFRAFSVDAAYIPYLAAVVRKTHVAAASALAAEACHSKTSAAVRALLGTGANPARPKH